MFKRFLILFPVLMLCSVLLQTVLVAVGWAQEAPAEASKWQPVIDLALKTVLPALTLAVMPYLIKGMTWAMNTYVKAYVPRELQAVIAGLLNAVVAILSGGDPVRAFAEGSTVQGYVAKAPEAMLATPHPDDSK